MSQEFRIKYRNGENILCIFFALAPGALAPALQKGGLDGKNGEVLAAAFAANAAGSIYMIERYKNGKLNDGPNGEPAWHEFHNNGALNSTVRFTRGYQNDGLKGEPCLQVFNNSGKLVRMERYQRGTCVEQCSAAEMDSYLKRSTFFLKNVAPKAGTPKL